MSKTPDNLSGESVDAICASLSYRTAQTETKRTRAEWELASVNYDAAKVKERMAEMVCQCDPLDKILSQHGFARGMPGTPAARRACLKAAFYAVYGRVTDQFD